MLDTVDTDVAMPAMVDMDSDTETMVDTDLDSAERDLPMPNLNLMPMLTLMPKLMLTTVVVLDSMVDLAKDMVDTEAMVFSKQHTDSEVIPIMVDTDVLMEAMVDTEPMELVMEVTDDSGEEFLYSE